MESKEELNKQLEEISKQIQDLYDKESEINDKLQKISDKEFLELVDNYKVTDGPRYFHNTVIDEESYHYCKMVISIMNIKGKRFSCVMYKLISADNDISFTQSRTILYPDDIQDEFLLENELTEDQFTSFLTLAQRSVIDQFDRVDFAKIKGSSISSNIK